MRCQHCPLAEGRLCRGESLREACWPCDPGHRLYDPTHRIALILDSERPSLQTQAVNLAGAIGRAMGAAVRGEAIRVDDAEYARRLALCHACEFYDPVGRCRKCGCVAAWKARLASEHCPLNPPKW